MEQTIEIGDYAFIVNRSYYVRYIVIGTDHGTIKISSVQSYLDIIEVYAGRDGWYALIDSIPTNVSFKSRDQFESEGNFVYVANILDLRTDIYGTNMLDRKGVHRLLSVKQMTGKLFNTRNDAVNYLYSFHQYIGKYGDHRYSEEDDRIIEYWVNVMDEMLYEFPDDEPYDNVINEINDIINSDDYYKKFEKICNRSLTEIIGNDYGSLAPCIDAIEVGTSFTKNSRKQ